MSSFSLANLILLTTALVNAQDAEHKVHVLLEEQVVQKFLNDNSLIKVFIDQADPATQVVLLSVIAIGEGEVVFQGWKEETDLPSKLQGLADQLIKVETFYDSIGGVAGYHRTILELIEKREDDSGESADYLQPPRVEIGKQVEGREEFIEWGVKEMPRLAEIYPVGGAGDRLSLVDETTGEALPAAKLQFAGRTLLELLFRDLQGRELLYEKVTGKPLITPVVLMTSVEKDNDRRIREICEENQWFGRPKESFFFIVQPLVPVVTVEGHWVMSAPFVMYRKPGGHGVLWKLMKDQGAFEWLEKQGRTKALVRQINNPLAGEDDGLLAFTGVGLHYDKGFGFAACPRKVHSAEGMNVLIKKNGTEYSLTNIEYTDFTKRGIQDVPDKEGSEYSLFPANTNILFVDLEEIQSLVNRCPVPGMLINLKSKAPFRYPDGTVEEIPSGRLESTMQNIADEMVFDSADPKEMPVFLTYNRREKTIGVTKNSFDPDHPSDETPDICFYTLLTLHRDLLVNRCGMDVPPICSKEEYLAKGPNVIFLYHPSLGPGYDLIGKKIKRGRFHENAELQVEMSNFETDNLELSGSLLISGDLKNSSCRLNNVCVRNKGINRELTNTYWKNQYDRLESLEVILEGKSEWIAENVTFEGDLKIVVPDGVRKIAFEDNGKLVIKEEKIE